jgi:hypothetical protein
LVRRVRVRTALASVLLAGCVSGPVVVVAGDRASSPVFTVLPHDASNAEAEFANQVELVVTRAGLSVIERPPFAPVTLDAERTVGRSGETITAPVRFADPVALYDMTSASYVVTTSASDHMVRIVERQSRALVASFAADPTEQGEGRMFDARIYSALVHAGFVKARVRETQCQVVDAP